MSIFHKNNAIGVDAEINSCMKKINRYLNTEANWGIDIYHKIYRERKQDRFAPFAFRSDGDYKERFLNDKVPGEVGFYLSNIRETGPETHSNVDCDVIFSINLDKIDGGSLQREDERAIMMAFEAVSAYTKDVTAIKTELRRVFSEFDTDRIKHRDMQPFLNFSFTININYKNTNCYGM